MVGVAFRQGRQLQQPGFRNVVGMDGGHIEYALGQRAGLIKDHDLGTGQYFQIVAAFDQNAVPRGPADAAEEGEGHRDDQSAGAGDHQKIERPGDGVGPGDGGKQRGQERQRHGGEHHGGRVIAGEFGNKVFRFGLFAAGVLHQVQNLGDGGFRKGAGHLDRQHAGQIHAAGDHVVPALHLAGQGLAGKGGGVYRGGALQYYAVQRDALACLDDDGAAHRHLLRGHLDQGPILFYIGIIGPDIHQGSDRLAGLGHRVALEELAHLIEEHDENGLRVFAHTERPHSGQGHEKVLVKDLAASRAALKRMRERVRFCFLDMRLRLLLK